MNRHGLLTATGALAVLVATTLGPRADAQQPPASPSAPTLPPPTIASALVNQYNISRLNLTRIAAAMPADDYAFKPTPEMRTFAGNVVHAARSARSMCGNITGDKAPATSAADDAAITTKEAATKLLADAFASCAQYVKGLTMENINETYPVTVVAPDGSRTPGQSTRSGLLANLVSHNQSMSGYMSVYLRLKGITPPASVRDSAPPKTGKEQ